MQSKHVPPTFGAKEFHCPRCQVYAAQQWFPLYYYNRGSWSQTSYQGSSCFACKDFSYWENDHLINPSTAAVALPHEDMPENCTADYLEARDILTRSPRGAAALLRLCLQKLMPALGEKGNNINDDIAALVQKGLPVEVQQALDFCRVVGNNAVHPGEIQIDDTPEMADQLFTMINFIIEDRVSRPKRVAELFARLPAGALAAIEKRDAKAVPVAAKIEKK